MCGIAGIITSEELDVEAGLARAEAVQMHRGPDARGVRRFTHQRWQIGFGHQRLAIIDLTSAGIQPMRLQACDDWIIYNGEIYNYKEIRQELEALNWRFHTETDTEVLLAALHVWGPCKAQQKFNGMWAFAYYQEATGTLTLGRDRFGIKPLYFRATAKTFIFASEIKAILEITDDPFKINKQKVGEYIAQSLIDTSELTFFDGILKLDPGHFMTIQLDNRDEICFTTEQYWKLEARENSDVEPSEAIKELDRLFTDAVRLRLRSDVPVGVLLSGGLDSSSIAAIMHRLLGSDSSLNLLSAVSDDEDYDESPFIDMMAGHLNRPVSKVQLDITAENSLELLARVIWHNDEPVGSFANVAHYLLMQKAAELGITVILSGQGADESLCGYKKFLGFHLFALCRRGRVITAALLFLSFLKRGTIISQFTWSEAKRYLPGFMWGRETGTLSEAVRSEFRPRLTGLSSVRSLRQRQIEDFNHYSIPALTHYEDRMSMSSSREMRFPFLDHRIVEFIVSLPHNLKLQEGWTKWVLRHAMRPYLPAGITWRKDKQGFVNPQAMWLRNELRGVVMEMFSGDALIYKSGLIDKTAMLKTYERYCAQTAGRGIVSYEDIFRPMALEVWLQKFQSHLQLEA